METPGVLVVVIGVLLAGLSAASCHTCGRAHKDFRDPQYTVPQPEIKVFRDRGFEVSIPDSEGVQLFAFHGKINEEMAGLEAGQFSRDILTTEEGRWVFRDKRCPLRIGDKIYFWLFVQRHNLGYRLDDQEFEVKEYADRQQKEPETNEPSNSLRPQSGPPDDNRRNRQPIPIFPQPADTDLLLRNCERIVVNITDAILSLQRQVEELRDTNEILRDITAIHPPSGRFLRFTGRVPPGEDALSVAQGIVKNKLKLGVTVVSATRKDQDIVFEVASLNVKVKVIKAAREELKDSQIILAY